MEKVSINKDVIIDLARLTNEINNRVESLELMSDSEFMRSLKKSDEEVKNKDFAEWNEL
tara:strand:+ start:153 stop:329 length:177 start_codon:yes stop_codon:yes gene_type:complete